MPQITDPNLLAELNGVNPGVRVIQQTAADPMRPIQIQQAQGDITRQPSQLAISEADATKKTRDAQLVDLDAATKQRQDYEMSQPVKNYTMSLPVYSTALQTMPNSAGDLNLVYAAAKVFDPTSVVRESEQATIANLQPIVDKIAAQFGKQVLDGGTFTDENRSALRRELKTRMAEFNRGFIGERVKYKGIADRYGLNPMDIIGEHPGGAYQEIEARAFGEPVSQLDYSGKNEVGQTNPDGSQEGPQLSPRVGNDYTQAGGMAGRGVTTETKPVPQELQAEYNAWLDSKGRGFDPQDYAVMRMSLDRKYGYGIDEGTFAKYAEEGKRIADPASNVNRAIPGVETPLSQIDQARNNLIQTDMGTTLTTGINAATFGIPTMLAGNEGVDAVQKLRDDRPVAALVGDVVGGVVGAKGLGMATAAGSRAAGLSTQLAERLANPVTQAAVQGGITAGNNSRPGERLANAALGAAIGAGGVKVFQAAAPAIGAGLSRLLNSPKALANRMAQNASAVRGQGIARAGEAEGIEVSRAMVDQGARNRVLSLRSSLGGDKTIEDSLRRTTTGIEKRVDELGGGGTVIDEGAMGDTATGAARRALEWGKTKVDGAYQRARNVAGDPSIVPTKAIQDIDDQIAELSGAPEANKGIIEFLKGVRKDFAQDGGISLESFRQVRRSIPDKIEAFQLGRSEAAIRSRAGRIMKAGNKDFEDAFSTDPRALAAYKFADKIHGQREAFRKEVIHPIFGKIDDPIASQMDGQKVFANIQSLTKKGQPVGRLNELWKTLKPEEAKDLATTLAAPLGRQAGGEFSPALLVSHVSKLSPAALKIAYGPDGAASLQNLVRLSNAVAKVPFNTSGSAVAQNYKSFIPSLFGLGGGTGVALATGSPGYAVAGLAAGGAASGLNRLGNYVSARMIMSPRIQKWIMTAPATNDPAQIMKHLSGLSKIAAREPALSGDIGDLQNALGKMAGVNDE